MCYIRQRDCAAPSGLGCGQKRNAKEPWFHCFSLPHPPSIFFLRSSRGLFAPELYLVLPKWVLDCRKRFHVVCCSSHPSHRSIVFSLNWAKNIEMYSQLKSPSPPVCCSQHHDDNLLTDGKGYKHVQSITVDTNSNMVKWIRLVMLFMRISGFGGLVHILVMMWWALSRHAVEVHRLRSVQYEYTTLYWGRQQNFSSKTWGNVQRSPENSPEEKRRASEHHFRHTDWTESP